MGMRVKNIYLYIIFFLFIMSSGTVTGYKIGGTFFQYSIIILASITLFMAILDKKFYIFLSIIIVWIMIESLVGINFNSFIQFIIKFIIVLSVIWYCNRSNINFFAILEKIIRVFMIYGLIAYLLINIIHININFQYIDVLGYGIYKNYSYLYYSSQTINWYGLLVPRNQCIFIEPGAYQIFLNLGLIVIVSLKNKIMYRKFFIILYIISIISTFSTTGIILGLIICFIKFYSIYKNEKIVKIFKIAIIPILIVICVYLIQYVGMQKIQFGESSYTSRTSDLQTGFYLFLQKPILGWGYMNYDMFESGNSNGLITVLYQLGIIGFFIYMIPLLGILLRSKKELIFRIFILLFFILSNSNEPMIYSNFVLIFLSYGVVELLLNKQKIDGL